MRPKAMRRSIDERVAVCGSEESPEVAVCSVVYIVPCECLKARLFMPPAGEQIYSLPLSVDGAVTLRR